MKKILVALLFLAALGGFAMAQEALEGLSVGGEFWKDADEEGDVGFAPFAEYEKSIDALDIYLKAEYDVKLDDDTNQAFYLEEGFTYNIEGAGPGTLSFAITNYNLFGTSITEPDDYDGGTWDFYGADDSIYGKDDKVTGYFEFSAGYEVEGFSITAGFDWGYLPGKIDVGGAEKMDTSFKELFGIIGYTHSTDIGDFGIEGTAIYTLDYGWKDYGGGGEDKSVEDLYEFDIVLSYAQEKFQITLEADLPKNYDGKFLKDYTILPGVEVYIDNFTIFGELQIAHVDDANEGAGDKESKTWTGFLVGLKYAF
ncbi:MAG: hypothetical protein LBQ57_07360 [Spirochaetales bacterium]|jgi:hypothetical protein|nr:hypothetical protein [Spirochaetales bacterium]